VAGLDIFGTGYAAREKVFDSYRDYMKALPEDVALVIKERVRVQREAGVPEYDLAKIESAFAVAIFGNTSPTLFWTIWELFSRNEVLSEVRHEIESQAVTGTVEEGFQLDVAAIKLRCPLLLSIYEETQRTRHVHANIRKVLDDTLLDGKYLLKAGNYLQMPGAPVHSSENMWGPSASEFDPYRFANKKGTSNVPGSAFLSWGAPPHLCPARQFASTEILIIIALLAMRADLCPVQGVWNPPALYKADMVTVLNPKSDIRMEVTARKQWRGKWSLKMSESTSRISLASG
jgi:cytochrome P450